MSLHLYLHFATRIFISVSLLVALIFVPGANRSPGYLDVVAKDIAGSAVVEVSLSLAFKCKGEG